MKVFLTLCLLCLNVFAESNYYDFNSDFQENLESTKSIIKDYNYMNFYNKALEGKFTLNTARILTTECQALTNFDITYRKSLTEEQRLEREKNPTEFDVLYDNNLKTCNNLLTQYQK